MVKMKLILFGIGFGCIGWCWGSVGLTASPTATTIARPFELQLRSRIASDREPDAYLSKWSPESWNPRETAVIVCDMWDSHHCYRAVQRVKDMAPRMNQFLNQARQRGALIVHAPSSCMGPYAGHPARRRAEEAPQAADIPADMHVWCDQIPAEESGVYPLDQSDGGEDDDPFTHQRWHEYLAAAGRNPGSPWRQQIETLEIHDEDAITDSGVETWNLLRQYGIQNVLVVGVHTNMCVLGRPFGLRQLSKNGLHVALVRDMTDTMYNPAMWPHVNHHTGTDRIVEHIEKYVCPTIESRQLMGGSTFRFYDDHRPTVALIVSEEEYQTATTLPRFAAQHLGQDFRVPMTLNNDKDSHRVAGLTEVLADADVLLLSMWRRTLPEEQLAAIRQHLAHGKHLVAIRTSSHAFVGRNPAEVPGKAIWPNFDREILGGHYQGHFGNHADQGDEPTLVRYSPEARRHPVLTGIEMREFPVASWLYKMTPLAPDATLLMTGRIGSVAEEPVSWVRTLDSGSRVFYTSLGHPDDFDNLQFQRLLANAVYWAAGLPTPELFPLTGPPATTTP